MLPDKSEAQPCDCMHRRAACWGNLCLRPPLPAQQHQQRCVLRPRFLCHSSCVRWFRPAAEGREREANKSSKLLNDAISTGKRYYDWRMYKWRGKKWETDRRQAHQRLLSGPAASGGATVSSLFRCALRTHLDASVTSRRVESFLYFPLKNLNLQNVNDQDISVSD